MPSATMTEKTSPTTGEKKELGEHLFGLLSNTYVLYLKTQNFHWNVTGPLFPALHLMFETQYQEAAQAIDEIAERIRALGYLVPATFDDFKKRTFIEETTKPINADEMVQQLASDHANMAKSIQELLSAVEDLHDEATLDLLIDRLKTHEKTAWMLKSSIPKPESKL